MPKGRWRATEELVAGGRFVGLAGVVLAPPVGTSSCDRLAHFSRSWEQALTRCSSELHHAGWGPRPSLPACASAGSSHPVTSTPTWSLQRQRRNAVLAALAEHLPHASIEGVAAGLHLLITLPGLPGSTDDTELAAALRQTGIVVHPPSWHRHRHRPGPPGLIPGCAAHPPDRLRDAVRRLAAVVGSGDPAAR